MQTADSARFDAVAEVAFEPCVLNRRDGIADFIVHRHVVVDTARAGVARSAVKTNVGADNMHATGLLDVQTPSGVTAELTAVERHQVAVDIIGRLFAVVAVEVVLKRAVVHVKHQTATAIQTVVAIFNKDVTQHPAPIVGRSKAVHAGYVVTVNLKVRNFAVRLQHGRDAREVQHRRGVRAKLAKDGGSLAAALNVDRNRVRPVANNRGHAVSARREVHRTATRTIHVVNRSLNRRRVVSRTVAGCAIRLDRHHLAQLGNGCFLRYTAINNGHHSAIGYRIGCSG